MQCLIVEIDIKVYAFCTLLGNVLAKISNLNAFVATSYYNGTAHFLLNMAKMKYLIISLKEFFKESKFTYIILSASQPASLPAIRLTH